MPIASMIGYAGLLVLLCLSATSLAVLPPGITGCSVSLSKNNFNQCVLNRIAKLTPLMRLGIPEWNLPPMDPFYQTEFKNAKGSVPFFNLRANLTKIHASNTLNYTISNANFDPRALKASLEIHMPLVNTEADFDAVGSLLFLSLNSVGNGKAVLKNVDILVSGNGKEVIDNTGVKRVAVKDLKMKFNIGTIHVNLQGSQKYAAILNAIQNLVNSNPGLVLNIARPIIDSIATQLSRPYLEQVWNSVTKDEVFLK